MPSQQPVQQSDTSASSIIPTPIDLHPDKLQNVRSVPFRAEPEISRSETGLKNRSENKLPRGVPPGLLAHDIHRYAPEKVAPECPGQPPKSSVDARQAHLRAAPLEVPAGVRQCPSSLS
jgi:hypothetical protein